MDGYFDEEYAGEYFIDPNDLESESIEIMGSSPDWEELYDEGFTAWYDRNDNIVIYLFGAHGNCSISINEIRPGSDQDREIHHELFAVCLADCFADICAAHLRRATELLKKYCIF